MNNKGRNYTYLKKNMNSAEFKGLCKQIAIEYAKSENHFSYSYFVKNYNITKSCFYRILEEAIVTNLISEDDVRKMEIKAISNQKNYAANAGESTLRHYALLRSKRNNYILESYSNEQIKSLAEDFAANSKISKLEFAEKYDISIVVLDKMLKKAFIENIIDDQTCKEIEKRSLKKDSSKRAKEFFEYLWTERRYPN